MSIPIRSGSNQTWDITSANVGVITCTLQIIATVMIALGYARNSAAGTDGRVSLMFIFPPLLTGAGFLLYRESVKAGRVLAWLGSALVFLAGSIGLVSIGLVYVPFTTGILLSAHGLADQDERFHYIFYPAIFFFLALTFGVFDIPLDFLLIRLHLQVLKPLLDALFPFLLSLLVLTQLAVNSVFKQRLMTGIMSGLLLAQMGLIAYLVWFRISSGVWWRM